MKNSVILALLFMLLMACNKELTTEERWEQYRQKTGDSTEYFNIEDTESLLRLRQMMDEWQDEEENNEPEGLETAPSLFSLILV